MKICNYFLNIAVQGGTKPTTTQNPTHMGSVDLDSKAKSCGSGKKHGGRGGGKSRTIENGSAFAAEGSSSNREKCRAFR